MKKEKILIVGTGPVGLTIYKSICRNYPKSQLFLSDFQASEDFKQNQFGPDTLYYRKGRGGLGRYWHGVMDVDLVKSLGTISSTSYFAPFNKILDEKMEFIPFQVPRFNNSITIQPPIISIEDVQEDGVTVKDLHQRKIKYDFVFISIGIGNRKYDPLINSGISKKSDFLSDHIIFNSQDWVPSPNYDIIYDKKGHFRKYQTISINNFTLKCSFRPAISRNIANPKNKAIYTQSKNKIIGSMLNKNLFGNVMTSAHLRYGFPAFTKKGFNFYQMKIKDIFKINNQKVLLNRDVFEKTELQEIFKILKINKESILSGIHLHGGYKNIEQTNLIGVNENISLNHRLRIITPNIDNNIDERHFTSYLMRLGEITSEKLNA